MKREVGKERRVCGVGSIDAGRGQEPKRGIIVAVTPRALRTHCSSMRKEVPSLVTDNYTGGTA